MYPKIILDLIENLKKLPGIGEKTAERLALNLTSWDNDDLMLFGSNLLSLKQQIKYCKNCGLLTDKDTCDICQNKQRNQELLMIVEDSKDVYAIEKTNTYQGLYHILGGLIDFSRGIEPKDLNIDTLENRLNMVQEIVIATNGIVEGELTAQYLKSILKDKNISITRLAYGLPVGTELKYADQLTLIKAVENRQKY